MGYEIKMYVVEASCSEFLNNSEFVEHENKWFQVWDDDSGEYIYNGDNRVTCPEGKRATKSWCKVIAMVDLCNPGYDSAIYNLKGKDSDHYFYSHDDYIVIDDCYGDMMQEHSIESVIEALESDLKDESYRRFSTALGLLRAMQGEYNNLKILFYGY